MAELKPYKIDEMPTIEAKPVVHAHWEKDPITKWMSCSNCGGDPPITKYINVDGDPYESNFCPFCGAQMDEVASDINVGSKGVKIPVISMEDVPKIMKEMENNV